MEMKKVAAAAAVVWLAAMAAAVEGGEVTYDGRALLVNGTRRILFSGSIHYPRSTPEMWPSLIAHAKQGGLDVIQTYVFWNIHEPVRGQFNFQGRYDIVRFIKEIWAKGLYVSLRIGPFIESEWKYGGFPFWLHDIPGIVFRCDNEPFKVEMQRFASMVVNMMKSEGLYASQGGPIIISQIENEYANVEPAFHESGPPYVRWAGSMAVGLQTGVPWMMCKQDDAPGPVINSCNGMRCGETFKGPNSPDKPALWTENWTSLYQVYGGEPYIRSAEDIAFHVALFITAKGGSFVNYYMYHGGTNFGNSASPFVTTSYYDEAPLDEYGLIRQTKWGHLRELHAVIQASSEPLLWGTHAEFPLGQLQKAHVFQTKSGKCAAFLINIDSRHAATVNFRNVSYEVPPKSISILQDCNNVVFNSAKVNAQSGVRSSKILESFGNVNRWTAFADELPDISTVSFTDNDLLEQMNITKDGTDYLWYTVSYNPESGGDQYTLRVNSFAHVLHAFVNGAYVGTEHGSHDAPNVVFEKPISLKNGQNNSISLLSVMVGLPDNGAYLERRVTGLRRVSIQGRSNATIDISNHQWGYKAGLMGEKQKLYNQQGSASIDSESVAISVNQPLRWFKTLFDAPPGTEPLALNLGSMGKGEVYVNGESIGRYWVSFKMPTGQPSQSLYHIPRSFLKPSGNLLVIFEEISGDPLRITLESISITSVCGSVSESHPPPVLARHKQQMVQLKCQQGKTISAINFASYGNPTGDCKQYSEGSCHAASSRDVAEKVCLGKRRCSIPVSASKFGDPCPGISKSLMVVASCD